MNKIKIASKMLVALVIVVTGIPFSIAGTIYEFWTGAFEGGRENANAIARWIAGY